MSIAREEGPTQQHRKWLSASRETDVLLEGKTAVVYGAGGSVGSTVARSFAREGATATARHGPCAARSCSADLDRPELRHVFGAGGPWCPSSRAPGWVVISSRRELVPALVACREETPPLVPFP